MIKSNGNPSDKKIKKWSKKRHPTYKTSYKDLFKDSGGSTKMGVRTKVD